MPRFHELCPGPVCASVQYQPAARRESRLRERSGLYPDPRPMPQRHREVLAYAIRRSRSYREDTCSLELHRNPPAKPAARVVCGVRTAETPFVWRRYLLTGPPPDPAGETCGAVESSSRIEGGARA